MDQRDEAWWSRTGSGVISLVRKWFGSPAPDPSAPEPAAAPVSEREEIRRYSELCRRAGLDRVYLLLTFDCDTDGDFGVVQDLERELRSRAIKSGYAVPGAQLRKAPDTWRRVAETGAEFLNHGSKAHAEFRDGRYWPVMFYEKLDAGDVVADITAGHRDVIEIAGVTPVGFRAPHFGSFQEPADLELIYNTVKPLGYTYCSTTTPALALSAGPLVDRHGLTEIPTMGSYRNPTTLLDSWTYLTDRVNYALGDEYHELFAETIERFTQAGLPALLTYYADPSHVYGQPPFERTLDVIAKYGVPSLFGREAVSRFTPLTP